MLFCQLPMVNFKDTKYFLLVRMVNVQGNARNTKKKKLKILQATTQMTPLVDLLR